MYLKVAEYCHLLKANLYNIAWQRECPTDLREAVESLHFAASHCSDLPELKDVREIMANKYGKDFSASSLVSKQFLQAFYENTPPEDTKKALMKGICAEFHIKYPQQMEVSSKASKQPVCIPVPAENSSSVHGQDISYGSLDTHGVHFQEGDYHHHKQIRSSSKPVAVGAHTDATVQVAGKSRGRRDQDMETVDQISKQRSSVPSHKPSHEKPYLEEVESRPIHAKLPQKREGKVKKYGEDEDVKLKMRSENFNGFERVLSPQVHAKHRGKGKVDKCTQEFEDGQTWPKHSVKVHDHDKAETERSLQKKKKKKKKEVCRRRRRKKSAEEEG